MTAYLTAQDLWADISRVRSSSPLVHCITNFVVMNFNANVLLATGASPVMAHAHEEVAEMAALAQAVVLNIGTLDPYWATSLEIALDTASRRRIPTVLDPVGVGATGYRMQTTQRLLRIASPTVIRGNGSEICSLGATGLGMRGVDSTAQEMDALGAARDLSRAMGSVVCVSGPTDFILSPEGPCARLSNGHEWMTRITGMGCSATALIGACCGVQPSAWRATVAAMAYVGVAGEIATERAARLGQGVGSMQSHVLDALQLLEQAEFEHRLRLEIEA